MLPQTSVRLRVFREVRQAVFGLLPSLDHGDFNHPVSIVQGVKRLPDLVLRAKWAKTFDFSERNGWRCEDCVHGGLSISKCGFILTQRFQKGACPKSCGETLCITSTRAHAKNFLTAWKALRHWIGLFY